MNEQIDIVPENDASSVVKKPRKKRSVIRKVIGTMLCVFLLLLALPFTLYIPVVQDFICQRVVAWLNTSSDELEFHVGSVRIDFPLRLRVNDVQVMKRVDGSCLVSVGSLRTGLDDLPINQPYFVVDKLDIQDVKVQMDSLTESFGLVGSLTKLQVTSIEVDPIEQQLRIAGVDIQQPDLNLRLGSSTEEEEDTESAAWNITLAKANIQDGHLLLNINNLDVDEIQLEAEHISYDASSIHAHLLSLSGREKTMGLNLSQLSLVFDMKESQLAMTDLDLQMAGKTSLQGEGRFDLGLLDSIRTGSAEVHMKAAIDSANLIRIASLFEPRIARNWVNSSTSLNVDALLTADTLDLRNLTLQIPDHVFLMAEAFALSPFDDDKRSVAATLKADLKHSDFLLSSFLSGPAERDFCLPDSLEIDLEASQHEKNISARADLRSLLSDVLSVEAKYNISTEGYHLMASTHDFDVQQFVPSAPVDYLTLHAEADGRHFRFPGKWTRLEAVLLVDSIGYQMADGTKEKLYDLEANALLKDGSYMADLRSGHPTAQLDTHLEGLFTKDTLTAAGHIDAPQIDLAHLPAGLGIPDLGILSFCSNVSAAYNWGDVAEGRLQIDSLKYADSESTQKFDDIQLNLESRPGMLYADATGGDAALYLNTDHGISEFPEIVGTLGAEVNRQLGEMRFDFNALQQALPQGQVDFHMAHDNPFYPAINHFGYDYNTIDISAYNLYSLILDANVVGLRNEDRTIDFDSIIAEIRPCKYQPKGDSLAALDGYRLTSHALHIDPKARETYDIHANGLLMPDSVMLDVKYVDGNYVTLYDAAASVAIGNDTVTLRLEKDPVLYAQPFTVNADNYISLMEYRGGMEHHRTNTSAKVMMKGPRDMSLDIYTRKAKNRDIGNQMLVRLQNLDLDYATKTVMGDADVDGRLNLTAMADLYPDSLGGQLRAGIKSFRLGEYGADTLAFDGRLQMAHDRRDIDGILTVDSIVKLQLAAALTDTVNLQVGIKELPLPLANLFMPSSLRLDGTTTGQLTMRGKSFEEARMDAFVAMNDATVCITDLDGLLTLPSDTLRIRNNRLNIQDYQIQGVNKRPITLRGTVDMRKELSNPAIDLRISGENVRIADSRRLRLPEQYIFGRLPITTDLRVKGKLSDMDVTGKLQVLSGTDLKYYLQDDPLQATSRVDQLVDFVSFRQMDRELAHNVVRPLVDASEEGISVELKIDIDRDVKVDAYLPGEDNNHVSIQGGGSLVMQCAPDGSLTMSGVYDVTNGDVDYKLPVLPMTKRFNILNSSFVSWNGVDPGSPAIDIKASENVRATVSDNDGSRIVQFVVTINITGTLDALDMTFTCSAPEDGTINSEIESMTDEERSKTALMLLVAQTYMGASNNSSMGMGTANAALNSVLNRQMDQMLGSALKHTDVDLGIDTYSTDAGAARTDYSIKVSQRFLNDRFRATIGGHMSSGGDASMDNGARLGDMSLEWLIKKDGTHYLKLYRRYNYQSVLEGEVIESGIGYTQERTAYKFKHLLIPTSKKRQARLATAISQMQQAEEEEERKNREEADDNDD